MSDYVIDLQNVSKLYRIWNSPSARFQGPMLSMLGRSLPGGAALSRKAASLCRDFYALSNIDLNVMRGESVGIIGRNGAGKSTLLQIIAGTLRATSGSVEVNGRVSALLELGSGFNPEFSGRDNVYLNASILGLTKDEIDERFNQIVDFAEIGDFLDQPVRTYSSGMMMRLAFAVQTAVDPDVLIVDEALSVGDSLFQAKCVARMRQMLSRGLTLLFVTHDVALVTQLCQRALYLRNGESRMFGKASECVDLYLRDLRELQSRPQRNRTVRSLGNETADEGSTAPDELTGVAEFHEDPGFDERVKSFRYGSGRARLRAVELLDADGEPASILSFRERVTVRAHIELYADIENLNCCLLIRNKAGVELLHGTSREFKYRFEPLVKGTKLVVDIGFENILKAGQGYSVHYTVNDTISDDDQEILDLVEVAAAFEVKSDPDHPIYYLVWHPLEFSHLLAK